MIFINIYAKIYYRNKIKVNFILKNTYNKININSLAIDIKIESLPLTDMWYINGRVESFPLTNMRYINGWVESMTLHHYDDEESLILHKGSMKFDRKRTLYNKR